MKRRKLKSLFGIIRASRGGEIEPGLCTTGISLPPTQHTSGKTLSSTSPRTTAT
jgi:hypothetical protein